MFRRFPGRIVLLPSVTIRDSDGKGLAMRKMIGWRGLGMACLIGLMALAGARPLFGQERGEAESVRMVEKGVAHIGAVGLAQALKDFSVKKGAWIDGELYLFALDKNGVILAHAANRGMIGVNMTQIQDANGKEFVREMLNVASGEGKGWVEYLWTNPVSGKLEHKRTYLRQVPGHDCIVLAGYYYKR